MLLKSMRLLILTSVFGFHLNSTRFSQLYNVHVVTYLWDYFELPLFLRLFLKDALSQVIEFT